MGDIIFAAVVAGAVIVIGPMIASSALTFAVIACVVVVVIDLALKAVR